MAAWLCDTHNFIEVVTGFRATDSFGTGTHEVSGSTGSAMDSSDADFPGAANAMTVMGSGAYPYLDVLGSVLPHTVIGRGIMKDSTWPAQGWILYGQTFRIGQNANKFIYERHNLATHTSTGTLVNNVPYTLGASNDLSNVRLFINGVFDSTSAGGACQNNTHAWEMGDFTGTGQRWQGPIDFCYVFNRALTDGEHSLIHADPFSIFLDPLRGFTRAAFATAGIAVPPLSTTPRLNAKWYHFWGGRS